MSKIRTAADRLVTAAIETAYVKQEASKPHMLHSDGFYLTSGEFIASPLDYSPARVSDECLAVCEEVAERRAGMLSQTPDYAECLRRAVTCAELADWHMTAHWLLTARETIPHFGMPNWVLAGRLYNLEAHFNLLTKGAK